MEQIITRCGYRCDLCLAYRPNVLANPSNQQILSDGWHMYFGFRIPPEKIICEGCMAEDPQLIDKACPVRPCVIDRALENCAECPEFGCARLVERLVVYEDLAARVAAPIPADDRVRFIAPYENKVRLEELRIRRAR
jgi:hypothetical protein